MLQGCFVALGPRHLVIVDGVINSALYQKFQKKNVWALVFALKLKSTWIKQLDNDLKHTSKTTSDWLKRDGFKWSRLKSTLDDLA